jgi:hypothetical protein
MSLLALVSAIAVGMVLSLLWRLAMPGRQNRALGLAALLAALGALAGTAVVAWAAGGPDLTPWMLVGQLAGAVGGLVVTEAVDRRRSGG